MGFIVEGGSIRMSDENVEAIWNSKISRTFREVWQLMAVTYYYWKFVHNFSALASPISDLIKMGRNL